MSDARLGEHETGDVEPTRRRVIVAVSIAAAIVGVIIGSQLMGAVFSSFPRGYCQTLAVAKPIGGATPVGELSLEPTAREAVDVFVAVPGLTGDPLPTDGWEEYRGRWVRDIDGSSYQELDLQETPDGWRVVGRSTCGR